MKEIKELGNLIKEINNLYNEVCEDWKRYAFHYNQSTTLISNLIENTNAFLDILQYRNFLNDEETLKITNLSFNKEIDHVRVKQVNSVFAKYGVYCNKDVKGVAGTIPVNKCFNDLLGIRIITEEEWKFEDIKEFMKQNFPKLKCINSSKLNYKATHVYFKKDNYNYQWELQIWSQNNKDNNLESHHKHKQEYTKWEKMFKNLKGGVQ